jgi:tetratricopeptide (TPR) repeat protein
VSALLVILMASPAASQTGKPATAPDARARLVARAESELAAGRRAEAAQLFAAAAEQHQSVRALLQLARIQAGDGNRAGALESLRKAATIAPNSEDVLSALAQVSLAGRMLLPAVITLEALTRMCPSVAQYHYLLGVALMQAGDMVAAVESLEQANRLQPDRLLTLIALGLSLNNRKIYADAKAFLARSLELEPESLEALAALSEAEDGLGETDLALQHAQRVLQKAGDNATANLVTGMVLMKRQRYEEARAALEKAVTADPASPKAYYQLSLAYARLGDEARSREYVDLYKKKLGEMEERVKALRGVTGTSSGGMRP